MTWAISVCYPSQNRAFLSERSREGSSRSIQRRGSLPGPVDWRRQFIDVLQKSETDPCKAKSSWMFRRWFPLWDRVHGHNGKDYGIRQEIHSRATRISSSMMRSLLAFKMYKSFDPFVVEFSATITSHFNLCNPAVNTITILEVR